MPHDPDSAAPIDAQAMLIGVLRTTVREHEKTITALYEQLAAARAAAPPVLPPQQPALPHIHIHGRLVKVPQWRLTAHRNHVVLRMDDDQNPEWWCEVNIPACALADWLAQCLVQRPGYYADVVRLLSEIGASDE
jgi:hypothetical protein